ncbi:type IV toxin-antitoxin system AbiEi family antitoxin domain-containing protein [Kocuria gwangalliensis]|uniref:Type IV toxin-antitoxin system AbiEi family antitoxin domain-containing protein n=1 Tax=Kocuria gwangalliensis TaxID=501592 RepID=A0ABP8WLI1_9MICC
MQTGTYLDQLREIALDQHGLVTTSQAAEEGVPPVELRKMLSRGRVERAAHGVYRIPQTPSSANDQYQLAVLWTGDPNACLSHESALEAWDITDIIPNQIHVTIPRHRRVRRKGGEGYILHHNDLRPHQKTWWEGIPITTVPTTIEHCITTGTQTYLIKQALERGARTSLLPASHVGHLAQLLEERDFAA